MGICYIRLEQRCLIISGTSVTDGLCLLEIKLLAYSFYGQGEGVTDAMANTLLLPNITKSKEDLMNLQNPKPEEVLSDHQFNLSDFALFLSVMRNKEAYEAVLSIVMNDDKLTLTEVKVEQVFLNKSGNRAIRLDAWATDAQERQFNTEMENSSDALEIQKRSRYYQSMMDTPILKSGRKTKYKSLPSTVIIFITQADIFKKDRAMYTFTEQCEEIADLKLEDGTTKIFLNMTSKNGRPELVSLLQYMKDTKIKDVELSQYDVRIRKLNSIVREVLDSTEWEAVKSNILEIGINKGREIGFEIGLEEGLEAGRKKGHEAGMKEGHEAGLKEGHEAGMKEGHEAGREAMLKELILRKIQKGKSVEMIAEELDEEVSLILTIYERLISKSSELNT